MTTSGFASRRGFLRCLVGGLLPLVLGSSGYLLAGSSEGGRPFVVRTIRGEVLDLACYVDSGAKGPQHAPCARACIDAGHPVGLLGEDGKTYVVAGRRRPLNEALAPYAASKVATRDGISVIENAEIKGR